MSLTVGDLPTRRLLLSGAAVSYAAVTVALVVFEQPGLGIGHFFYLPVALAAFALGPIGGAGAGVLATALFSAAIALNHAIPTRELVTISSPIRLTTFVLIGGLLGWFAAAHRAALAELRILAERDWVTGLPNSRAFEQAVDRRLAGRQPFALLLADVDGFRAVNDGGHTAGDDLLRRIGQELVRLADREDEVARIGGDEFAIVSGCRTLDEAARLAARLERHLRELGLTLTFGWSASPQEGENALSLYRAADERLYARRLLRDRRPRELHVLPGSG
jgi:diguanylate cyclase (GGDEF)-like protein